MIIRPLRVQDAAAFRTFVERLSPASRYARFQYVVKEVSTEMLRLLLVADPRSHVALAAFDAEEIVGEARYVRAGDSAEFAIAVADGHRRQGLARRLLDGLLRTARRRGVRHLEGEVLANNEAMLRFVTQAGFSMHDHEDARLLRVERDVPGYSGLRPANAFSRSANTARYSIGAGFG